MSSPATPLLLHALLLNQPVGPRVFQRNSAPTRLDHTQVVVPSEHGRWDARDGRSWTHWATQEERLRREWGSGLGHLGRLGPRVDWRWTAEGRVLGGLGLVLGHTGTGRSRLTLCMLVQPSWSELGWRARITGAMGVNTRGIRGKDGFIVGFGLIVVCIGRLRMRRCLDAGGKVGRRWVSGVEDGVSKSLSLAQSLEG